MGIDKQYLFVVLMPSHFQRVTFGHIEFHLTIGAPLSLFKLVMLAFGTKRTKGVAYIFRSKLPKMSASAYGRI